MISLSTSSVVASPLLFRKHKEATACELLQRLHPEVGFRVIQRDDNGGLSL
jgi:hypothetical protein